MDLGSALLSLIGYGILIFMGILVIISILSVAVTFIYILFLPFAFLGGIQNILEGKDSFDIEDMITGGIKVAALLAFASDD